jgi:hypothetical protein
MTKDVITLTVAAYEMIAANAASNERRAITDWMRSAVQPMTHTAWALARDIDNGVHLAAPTTPDSRDKRIAQLERALGQIIACEQLMYAGSASMDIAMEVLGESDDR